MASFTEISPVKKLAIDAVSHKESIKARAVLSKQGFLFRRAYVTDITTSSHSMLQRYPQLSAATAEDLLSSLVLSQSNFHVCLSDIWACKSLSIITLRCSNIEPPPRLNGYWDELFTSPLFCSVYCSYENNSHYCARCAVVLYFLSYWARHCDTVDRTRSSFVYLLMILFCLYRKMPSFKKL